LAYPPRNSLRQLRFLTRFWESRFTTQYAFAGAGPERVVARRSGAATSPRPRHYEWRSTCLQAELDTARAQLIDAQQQRDVLRQSIDALKSTLA